jgi:beta-glucanase (GH16 family)
MKKVFPIVISFIFFLISCKKDDAAPEPGPSYKLVWSEEFNYTGLPNPSFWDYEVGYIRNNEAQNYVANNLENSKVDSGYLTIRATYDASRPDTVRSASLITLGKFDFKYGKIEARIKMPAGKGTWPAFWTMGTNRPVVGWPRCGEIDIMEWLGFAPRYVLGSLHKADTNGNDNYVVKGFVVDTATNLSNTFHTYGMEWDSTQITIYYDTVKYAVYKATDFTAYEWAQFTKPHYVLVNLAMGGTSGGTIDKSKYPFIYQVDYIRYYKWQ